MIVNIDFGIREDGVKLIKWFDGIKQEDGTIIPSGYKIRKIGTDEVYNDAVDVEDSPYRYDPTDELIEIVEEVTENEFTNYEENIDNNEY